MSFEMYVAIGVSLLFGLIVGALIFWKVPRRLKHDYYVTRWKRLQQRCPDKEQWPEAIREADDLLGEALKRKKFKGKNTGERMVDAQKHFTSNDIVWFGHKLRTKLDINPDTPLTQNDVQKALFGLRQGLKDIGAL